MPETYTIQERIITALCSQLETIRTDRGYGTDMGANVLLAPLQIDTEDMPAVAVFPGVEESDRLYGAQENRMPVEIKAILSHAESNPAIVGARALGDVIRCVLFREEPEGPEEPEEPEEPAWPTEGTYWPLVADLEYKGGGVEEYPGQDDTVTMVSVMFEVTYLTDIGNPYTQP